MSSEPIDQNTQIVQNIDSVLDHFSRSRSALRRRVGSQGAVASDGRDLDAVQSVQILEVADGREVAIIQPNAFTISRIYTTGRPDGKRPHGCDSYHEYFCQRLEEYKQAFKTEDGFTLTEREWNQLFNESYDRYVRYLLFSSIKRWEDVQRDTDTNLQVLDLARRYAESEATWQIYQYKGYILMMNSIARAELALQDNDHFSALQIVDQGIQRTGKFCGECLRENQGQAENTTREHYLNNLIEYRSDLESVSESLSREENESTRAENDEDTIIQELEDLLQEMTGD